MLHECSKNTLQPCEKALIPIISDIGTEKELESYKQVEFDIESYKVDAGVDGITDTLLHDTKEKILMHRWRFPTLSLHGIEGAFDGQGSKTVIPRKVKGKFSLRIVPNMHPHQVEALVRAHVDAAFSKLNSPNKYNLIVDKAGFPWFRDPNAPNFQAAAKATSTIPTSTMNGFSDTGNATASPNTTQATDHITTAVEQLKINAENQVDQDIVNAANQVGELKKQQYEISSGSDSPHPRLLHRSPT